MKISKKQNIKISVVITFITMIISMVVHFLYTPFLLKNVGDDQYGLYGFATSALSWLTIAINAILSAYNKIISQEIAKDKENGEQRINNIYSFIVVCWSVLMAVISTVILILMYFNIFKLDSYNQADQNTIMILFGIISIQVIFTIATKVANLNITYNNHHIWIKLSTLSITILTPLITIPFLINGHGIITVVLIIAILNILVNIFDLFFDKICLKKKYNIVPEKKDWKLLWPIFSFCSIIFLNEIAYQIDNNIDNMVLGLKGYSSDITLYSLALSIVTIASTCSNMIYSPFVPTVFDNEANGRREENKHLFDILTFCQMFMWFFVTGGFISCGKEFVHIWIGEEREIVYYICVSLLLIKSISNCFGPSKDMMRAANKHVHRAILAICVTILNTTLTIIFVNYLPREQAIWGCIIGTGISSVLGWWIAANVMNYKYLKLRIGKYVLNILIFLGITAFSCCVPLVLNNYLLINVIKSEVLRFVLLGSMFVVLFVPLSVLINQKAIREIYCLLRSK